MGSQKFGVHPFPKGGAVIERGYMNGASPVEVGNDTLVAALNLWTEQIGNVTCLVKIIY